MKHAIRSLLAFVCLALSGWALADGVPLITPGPPIAANDPIQKLEATKAPDFAKLHPIVLNKNAFGSNVLIVTIDGKDYRFTGSMAPPPPPLSASQAKAGMVPPDVQSWGGSTGAEGERLGLTRSGKELIGTIELPPARRLWFNSGLRVMIETDRSKTPPFNPHLIEPSAPIASGAKK